MMIMKKLFSAAILILLLLFTSCVSMRGRVLSAEEEALLYPVESYVPEFFAWEEVRAETGAGEGLGAEGRVVPGVWRFDFKSGDPKFPLIYHAVKIELSSADNVSSTDSELAEKNTGAPKTVS